MGIGTQDFIPPHKLYNGWLPDSAGNSLGELTFLANEEAGKFFGAIVSSFQEPILILERDLTVQTANPAFYKHFQVDAQHTIQRKLYQLGNGQWDIPELRDLFQDVLKNDSVVREYRVDHDFEQLGRRVMVVNANRLRRHNGEVVIVLEIHDNTEIEFAREYSEKTVDALRDPFLILDWDLRVKKANRPFYRKFRVSPSQTEGCLIYELGNGQWNIPRLRELLEEILPQDSTFDDFEVEHEFDGIGHCVMLLNARRINHLKLILVVIEDVTEKKRSDVQQTLLLGELRHRVKNLLMTVRALSQLTLQGASSLENFAESFDGRLEAMARTQDLLVQGPDDTARLREIIRLELCAIGARETSTFNLQGPEMELSARAAHALAMTIHELATNAAKYGALSLDAVDGRVDMEWNISPAANGKTRLHFTWREHGIAMPSHRGKSGFGTQIIQQSVPYLFGGSSTLTFHADGVKCIIDVEIPSAELASGRTKTE